MRLRKLGWEAREKGIWETFREDELPEILKEEETEFRGYKTVGGSREAVSSMAILKRFSEGFSMAP